VAPRAGLTYFWHVAETKGLVYWAFLLRDFQWESVLSIPVERLRNFLAALELPPS
jgi:hypothetical protein